MEVTLLGTGGPLVPNRVCMGLLVTAPGCQPLLVDTCGGMEVARQLAAIGVALPTVVNVVVTHRHQDHAGGVAALLLARSPVVLYANADAHDATELQMEGYWPEWEHRPSARHVVAPGIRREVGGFDVEFVGVEHRVPTLAVRIRHSGKVLAYSADSLPCNALVRCAADADLFLCDAVAAASQGDAVVGRARETMHPLAREAGEVATRAGAGALALVHIARWGEGEQILAEARAAFDGPVTLPDDLVRYAI